MKYHILNDIKIVLLGIITRLFFSTLNSYCPCLATKGVFIPYHESELMDIIEAYIQAFHFAGKILFAGLLNKYYL